MEFLRRAAADRARRFDSLPALGVRGNGHGMMLEKNNREALQPILDDVRPRGAVFDTTGTIVNNLWAFGYRQTPQGRKPLLLAYRSAE